MTKTRELSTTRQLIKKLEDKTIPLKPVEPTKSLLFCSMPCEKQTALIRNRTVNSMEHEDTAGVAYRYLQTKRGEENTFYEAVCYGFTIIVFLSLITYLNQKMLDEINTTSKNYSSVELKEFEDIINLMFFILKLVSLIFVPHIPPNVSNTLRYRETKNACEEWLEERLSKDALNEIRQLPNDRNSLFALTKILKKENVSTIALEVRSFALKSM